MQENYNRLYPFKLMDLMTHCKFRDWYFHVEEFQAFYNGDIVRFSQSNSNDILNLKDNAFSTFSRVLLEEKVKQYYIGYLYTLDRLVTLPNGFKSTHGPGDSIIDYSKIIKEL